MTEEDEHYRYELNNVAHGAKNKPGAGPHGLGLPDDRKLIRKDIVSGVPIAVREIIEREYCLDEHNAYMTCRAANYFSKFYSCYNAKQLRKNCIKSHWYDEGLHDRGKQEYIEERSMYRLTARGRQARENPNHPSNRRGLIAFRKEEDMPKQRLSYFQALKLAWNSTNEK